MKQIVILSGKIQSGKSSALFNWIAEKSCSGFLTITKKNKKVFFDIQQNEYSDYEMETENENTISVGKYYLNKASFSKSVKIFQDALNEQSTWFVMDEIGKLEMNDEGHHQLLLKILSSWNQNLLIVVRDNLVHDVIKKYQLHKKSIKKINKEELINL